LVFFFIQPWSGQSGNGFLPHVGAVATGGTGVADAVAVADPVAVAVVDAVAIADPVAVAVALTDAVADGVAVDAGWSEVGSFGHPRPRRHDPTISHRSFMRAGVYPNGGIVYARRSWSVRSSRSSARSATGSRSHRPRSVASWTT
jgi:hypothetical protein